MLVSGHRTTADGFTVDSFRESMDLSVAWNGGMLFPVEVKSRPAVDFTGPLDYPFPNVYLYKTSKGSRSLPVILFSGITQSCICFCDDGSERVIATSKDRSRGYSEEVWAAPLHLALTWEEFVKALKEKVA